MRMRTCTAIIGGAIVVVGQFCGCTPTVGTGVAPNIEVDFALGEGLGRFDVEAGVPVERRGAGQFNVTGASVAGGTIAINLDAVTVEPIDTTETKGSQADQTIEVLEITAWIAEADLVETVCSDGEQYGPYRVELDADAGYAPVSIDPDTITLTQDTVDLLNTGEFSICLSVVSPVSGTVRIATLAFDLQPALP